MMVFWIEPREKTVAYFKYPIQPTGEQLDQLTDALLNALNQDELTRLVYYELDHDLKWINPGAGKRDLTTAVADLVVYFARREGGLKQLLTAALKANPQHNKLNLLANEWTELEFAPLELPDQHLQQTIIVGDQIGRDQYNVGKADGISAFGGGRIDIHGDIIIGGEHQAVDTKEDYVARSFTERNLIVHPSAPTESRSLLPYEPETLMIPDGRFIMGSDSDRPEESPEHVIEDLPTYQIGKYPVTIRQFAEFVRQTRYVVEAALLWDGNSPPRAKLDHPVTGVTWYEALAYCGWLSEETGRSYTLPTEAQWERAARGTDGRLYPWGNEWIPERCNDKVLELTSVDTFSSQNEYGCCDMVGNAPEWTSTLWGNSRQEPDPEYAYPWCNDGRDNLEMPETVRRVYRGGRSTNIADSHETVSCQPCLVPGVIVLGFVWPCSCIHKIDAIQLLSNRAQFR
ncbi:formylglycine-generating enzyme family protein [Chloroflexi bacterium TSY]|nr:formylglycine-generating enzyme family protein [Chloroflexi bacterium TSY]